MNNICQCTKCKKTFDDFKIDINFKINVDRLKENGDWEYIPNLDNLSREVLCYDCFMEFTDLMSAFNRKYTPIDQN